MNDIHQEIRRRYLDRLDDCSWREEDPRRDIGISALPAFVRALHEENVVARRQRLVRVIWGFRDEAAFLTLRGALDDAEPMVWKEALDGFVAIGGPAAIDLLRQYRLSCQRHANAIERVEWCDEAIEQIEENTKLGLYPSK